jgi:DNA-binding ferritin-like protein (Dps family)
MNDFLKRIFGDKKAWWAMEARANALPPDYRIIYTEIKKHLWKFSAGDGMDVLPVLRDLLDLFETGAAEGRRALEVTGEDLAGFCDELLRNTNTYTQNWRDSLNRNVLKKLRDEETKQ